MPLTQRWYQPWLALAGLSLIANGAWEWFAMSSYAMPVGGASAQGAHAGCVVATVGDVGITLVSYAAAAVIGTRQWLRQPRATTLGICLALGVLITILFEVVNVHVFHRWSYGAAMPIVAGIGLLPIVQWLVLPPLVLWSARRYLAGTAAHHPLQENR